MVYPGSWVNAAGDRRGALVSRASCSSAGDRGRVKAGGLAVGFVVFPIAIALGTLAASGVWWLLELAARKAQWQSIGGHFAACLLGVALVVFVSIYALLWKRAGVAGSTSARWDGGRS